MQLNAFKGIAAAGAALVIIFGLTSCGDSHEALMEDQLDLMEEVVDIVGEVKDKESAEEAAEKLQALSDDFEEIEQRMKDLGEPSKEVEKELEEKYEPRLRETMGKMLGMLSKTMEYPELGKAMEGMNFGK